MKESRDSVNERRTGYCKGKKDGIVWRKEVQDSHEGKEGQDNHEGKEG